MSVTWRWRVGRRGIALAALAVLSSIHGAAQPWPAAANPLAASTAAPREVPCRRNVYPIMPNTIVLEDNQPSWYRPVTMASIGLSPDSDEAAIPALNTTTANSPRFRVDMTDYGFWVLWKSKHEYSGAPLLPMLTGEGTLIDGFNEYPGWTPDPNGVLDAGDWLSLNFGPTESPLADMQALLDGHIAAKTRITLPVFDEVNWQDIGASPIARMQRLIEVRLLDYGVTQSSPWVDYLEFALLDNQKVCLATAALFMPNVAQR
ncbi:MAG TPA: hypothetical protein VD886_14765 [Herpetosiphonaceae bacterium]|nr:hypothetical protein [Herpetosiphonaceae bacterium]